MRKALRHFSSQLLRPMAALAMVWSFNTAEVHATHAMGGELTYECIGPDTYRVRLNFYRDCNGVAAPTNCNNGRRFWMRSQQCGANFSQCFSLDGVEIVTPICLSAVDRCNSSQGQYGIQRYRYSAVVDLGAYAGCGTDWTIDWDLCCRNNAISSLNNPGDRNLYLYATLDNTLAECNNSPRYLNDPTPFACVGQTVSYNHGFNDIDGDSLSFELAPALGAGGSIIPYNPGYSYQQPIITTGGANAVQIDPQTGTITFVPSQQQFSVVTVKVTEWRDGQIIGTYLRDVQFAIVVCQNGTPTVSGINGTGQYATTVCAGDPVCFTVHSFDPDPGQNVSMNWNAGIPGATFTVTGSPHPTGNFCWTPTTANIGQNLFAVNVEDDACVLNGVNNYGFTIQVLPPLTPVQAGPDQVVCGTAATLAGVLPYTQVQGTWSVVGGSAVFADANSPTTTVSGLTIGTNVLRWTVNYGQCGSAFDEVTIVAHDPGHPAAAAGPDQMLCTPANSAVLAANAALAPATGMWSVVAGSGTFADPTAPGTTVSGLAPGSHTFRWTITNGACVPATFDQVTITVFNSAQAAAEAGPDQELCLPGNTTVLAGNAAVSPATGQWTVLEGAAVFSDASAHNTTVSGLAVGTNVLQWTIANGTCDPATTSDQVTITVFDPASPAADAGPDQQVCTTTATLAANTPPAPATGHWVLVNGAGTFTDANDPTTTVTGLAPGANVFQWTLSNGACAGGITTDQVTVTRFDGTAATANAGPDQDLCTAIATGLASTTLAGNAPTPPSTGTWTVLSGTAVITAPGSATTTVTGMPPGVHVLAWTIDNGPCSPPTSTDAVTIRVFDRNAPAAHAGDDQVLCGPVASVQLAANAPTAPGTGQWTVVQGSGDFADASDPLTTVSGLGTGDNVFRWTLGNGPCPAGTTSDEVLVRVHDPAAADADAGADQTICGTATVTLTANAVTAPATGQWSLVSGAGTIGAPNSATTTVTGVQVGVSVFQWTVVNGPCGSSIDQVVVTRYSDASPTADAGPDQSICIPTAPNLVVMAGSTPIFPATGTWSIVAGGGSIANVNDPATAITALPAGTNVFRWTVVNGPCADPVTFDDVIVLVFDAGNPVADAGPDQQLCSSDGGTTMAGSALISPATGQWTLVNGTAVIADPADPNTAITGMPPGQHIFQWTVGNGPCGAVTTDQVSIFVYDPLQPTADAGGDQSLCTSAGNTITLNGSPVIFPATGLWTMSGGPGTIMDPASPSTVVTGLTTGVYSFTWTVNNGACPDPVSSSTLVTVVADGDAQPADAGPDQSVCGTGTPLTMAANVPQGVATGSWSVEQGTAVFSDPTSPTASVTGLGIGVNILQWNIDNVECGITTDQMTILVFDPAHPVADAGADQHLCTPVTSTQLQGNATAAPAVGTWTLVQGIGTIAAPNSPGSTVSGLGIGENIFQWQVVNGVCNDPISTDLVSIFVYEADAPEADAGPDQAICTPASTVTMAANAPAGAAIGTWSAAGGGAVIVAPNDPATLITGLTPGVHEFTWSIDNGTCGISTDHVTIQVFDADNPVADAGPDQALCTPNTTAILAGSMPNGPATGQWTLVAGAGTFADDSDPNTTVTGLTVGVHTFAWTVDNGPCTDGITTDQVTITVHDEGASVADAGPDQQWCLPVTSAVLAANTPVFPATGQWTVAAGTAVFDDPTDPHTVVSGLGVGGTSLVWTVSNGPCDTEPASDVMAIHINDDAAPVADAGPDQALCTPASTTTMAGSAVVFPGTGTWTLVSGLGEIADPADPHTAITGLGVGVNVFRWTVDNGACDDPISFDEVSIVVFDEDNPAADAGADQALCTPAGVATLSGSPLIGPATGAWTLLEGQGTITSPDSPQTTVTGLGVGENIFVWTVSNGPCDDAITSDPVSIFLYDQNNAAVDAGPDQALCMPGNSTAMQAAPLTFPATGQWTLVGGGGTIADPTDPFTTVSGLPVGVSTFSWTVDNGPCGTGAGTDLVAITVHSDAQAPADAGPDQQLCAAGPTTTTLAANPVVFPATGQWTLVSGTGIIVNPSNPNTSVIDIGIGTSTFAWTVNNGPCADAITSDTVTVEVFDENTQSADAGADQDLCTPVAEAVLGASTVVTPGTGTWSILDGTGAFSDAHDPGATITGLQVGVTVLEWTVENGPCGGTTTAQMTITLHDADNPVADAGADQELCTPGGTTTATTMAGSAVIFPATGTWAVIDGAADIADPNDPNTAVSGLGVGVHLLQWTVDNGVCAAPTMDIVEIAVFDSDSPDA
ncbi:MAG: hypothetical protein RBT71_03515, partial [Flavobacteriales bacterium]|nr:hypothetical protein [Flavobacteriales bacterium]